MAISTPDAILRRLSPASPPDVRITREGDDSPDSGEIQFWSVVGNSADPLPNVSEETRKAAEKAHEAALTEFPGSKKILVNYSDGSVRFQDDKGKDHIAWLREFKDPSLADKIGKVRNLLGNRYVFSTTTDPNIDSNRPINVPPPLQKTTETWRNAHTNMSAETFIKRFYSRDDSAKTRIQTAEYFIENVKRKLTEKIAEKGAVFDNLTRSFENLTLSQREEREKIQKEIERLQELEQRFNNLDTFAIFMNVAHLPDDPDKIPEGERAIDSEKRARAIFNKIEEELKKQGNQLGDGRPLFKTAPTEAAIASYAIDVAGLFIHGRTDHNVLRRSLQQERHRTLNLNQKDSEVGASAEEFVVCIMAHLGTHVDDYNQFLDEALSSLALSKNMKELVKECFPANELASLFEPPSSHSSPAAVSPPPAAAIPPAAAAAAAPQSPLPPRGAATSPPAAAVAAATPPLNATATPPRAAATPLAAPLAPEVAAAARAAATPSSEVRGGATSAASFHSARSSLTPTSPPASPY